MNATLKKLSGWSVRWIAALFIFLMAPVLAWAAPEPPPAPAEPTYTLGYAMLFLCVILGIAAVVRSTTKATPEDVDS